MSQNQLSSSRPTNLLLHLFSFPQRLAPTACKATQARSVGTSGTSPLQCPLPSSVFLQWQVVLLPCWFPNLLQERQIPYYSTSCLHYHLDSFHPFQDDCPGHFPYDQSSANPIQTFSLQPEWASQNENWSYYSLVILAFVISPYFQYNHKLCCPTFKTFCDLAPAYFVLTHFSPSLTLVYIRNILNYCIWSFK